MYKKILLLFTIPFLFVLNGKAQTLEGGLKGGLNSSFIRGNGSPDLLKDLKIGATGGVFTTIHISGAIAVQPEVLFSPKGANNFMNQSGLKLDLDYVDVPVSLQWWLTDNIAVYTGAEFGFLVKAKKKSEDASRNIKDRFVFSEVSSVSGIEYRADSGLGAYIRYSHGLTVISKQSLGNLKNSYASIGISCAFL